MSGKIFVSIVAFMDPLLDLTIQNMLNTAKNPENITFGIVNQDTIEKTQQFENKYNSEQFKIISVLPSKSKGCCWARSKSSNFD